MTDNTNPWNGLKTYEEGEILYGRSEEIQALSMQIFQSHITVVYGQSGIGKSSLLNAGIFPIARKRHIFPVHIRLDHKSEKSYLEQIKNKISSEISRLNESIIEKELAEEADNETLWEFFHRIDYTDNHGNKVKPLIVFDQFEEIFTLATDKKKVSAFFRQLADLINNAMPDEVVERASNNKPSKSESSSEDQELEFDIFDVPVYSFKADSDFHIVFILREDYLSYLDRNTKYIPDLRNNNYCLEPINEEQAAEIIMKPRAGLVDKSVAKLIIEKVTGETNFELNGIAEIQVNSYILSLYLSRLYDKMLSEGASIISEELVEAHSDNIMDNFYEESIVGLSEDNIRWIENKMVNPDGHRDNLDKKAMLEESGISKDFLDSLINEKKIFSEFSYGGSTRVELIHDVLCPVILKHKQQRLEREMHHEMLVKAKKDKRKLIIKSVLYSLGAIGLVILCSIWWLHNNKDVKIIDQQQNLVLSIEEDPSVSDMDFWRAALKVTGIYTSGKDTLLFSREIYKSQPDSLITINTDSCSRILFTMDFGDFADIGKYENISFELPMTEIMESPYITLKVKRDLPDLISYDGKILLERTDVDLPVENAFIIMGDSFTSTDSLGNFHLLLENIPDEKSTLMIAKGGLGCFERSVINNNEENHPNIYKLMPTDSLTGFFSKVAVIDSIADWSYSTVNDHTIYCANKGAKNGIYVKFNDGHDDRLKMYWKKQATIKDRVMLKGYFYFKNEKEHLDKEDNGHFAYYFGEGYIDKKLKKDENNASYRNFEFRGYDAASNLRTITGKYYIVKGAGRYSGDITSNKRQIATFGYN